MNSAGLYPAGEKDIATAAIGSSEGEEWRRKKDNKDGPRTKMRRSKRRTGGTGVNVIGGLKIKFGEAKRSGENEKAIFSPACWYEVHI
jgi:hypothetical protein